MPHWFLERTFVTLDCVQTQMGQRLAKGREPEHYNFDEGVKCCPGNCTHVWHYAQGLSRIFPQIERENRDKIEYGLGFDRKTGAIRHRYIDPKFGDAIDGNCGTILRVLRERYLNECMTGFEWQVAAHMIWEGMLEKGLAIGKAIYDRYLPQDRNPYNEIECSDHYSRAMASYGAYVAICGYRYNGPQGKLAFGPRLQPEEFRAAFTTAEGWGRFTQKVADQQQLDSIELRYGRLALKELAFDKVKGTSTTTAKVSVDGGEIAASFEQDADRYVVRFADRLNLVADQRLDIRFEG